MDTRFLYRELFCLMPNGLLPNVKLLTVLKHLVQSGIMKISLIYCLLLCRSVQNLVRRGFWAEQAHLYMFLLLWCRSVENLVRRGVGLKNVHHIRNVHVCLFGVSLHGGIRYGQLIVGTSGMSTILLDATLSDLNTDIRMGAGAWRDLAVCKHRRAILKPSVR